VQRELRICEEPFGAFRAAAVCWLDWVDRHPALTIENRHDREQLYERAVIELGNHHQALTLGDADIKRVLAELYGSGTDAVGLFLSAWFNGCQATELDGVFEEAVLGYRLPAGKRLVVRSGSQVGYLGNGCAGELVNHGDARYLGYYADGGLVVNLGTVRWDMAWGAGPGVQVNLGRVTEKMGMEARGGVQVNLGDTKQMAGDRDAVHVFVENGTWIASIVDGDGALQLNFKRQPNYNRRQFDEKVLKKARAEFADLRTLLRPLTEAVEASGRSEKRVWSLRGMDWDRFESDVRGLIPASRARLGMPAQRIKRK
jgi:hypothetical protein